MKPADRLIQPSRKEFLALAKAHTLVPVCRTLTADLETPVSAFLRAAWQERECFLLESVEGGEQVGRYTFIGLAPYKRIVARGRKIAITEGKRTTNIEGDVFAVLREALGGHNPARLAGLPPFTAGAVGFFAYDAVRQIERLPEQAVDELGIPDACLLFFDEVLAFDHVRKEIWLVVTADVTLESPDEAYAKALKRLTRLEKGLAQPLPKLAQRKKPGKLKVEHRTRKRDFLAAVERTKEYIAAGDVFQTVISQRFDIEPGVDTFQVYRALRTVNPSPYMYFLRFAPDGPLGATAKAKKPAKGKKQSATAAAIELAGSSPELLVRVHGRRIEYRPIAGTRPRGADEKTDQVLAEEMLHDEKERAEHVMLVDLGRNDVGRVSDYGSVKVDRLMFVERYSPRHAPGEHHRRQAEAGIDGSRRAAGVLPGRNALRRSQGPGHGDHRGTGAGAARDVRRSRALRGLFRQPRLVHRHPFAADTGWKRLYPGRRGHRGRLGSRTGIPGVDEQGASGDPRHRTGAGTVVSVKGRFSHPLLYPGASFPEGGA